LTAELAEKLELFIYEADHEGGIRVTEQDIHALRESILAPKFNYGAPRIAVTHLNPDGSLQLVHDYQDDGRGLDIGRAERVIDYISRIWHRPVSLQTVGASGNSYVIASKQAIA
jgi:stage V sporulation protein R